MDTGPRTLFRFGYSWKPKWMLAPVNFHDDEMVDGLSLTFSFWVFRDNDKVVDGLSFTFSFWIFRDNGLRTLSRFGCFTRTKWTMVSVHFLVVKMVPYTLYTIHNHTRTTAQTKRTLLRGVSVPVCIDKSLFFYFLFYLSFAKKEREICFLKGGFSPLEALLFEREFFVPWSFIFRKGVFCPLGLRRGLSF